MHLMWKACKYFTSGFIAYKENLFWHTWCKNAFGVYSIIIRNGKCLKSCILHVFLCVEINMLLCYPWSSSSLPSFIYMGSACCHYLLYRKHAAKLHWGKIFIKVSWVCSSLICLWGMYLIGYCSTVRCINYIHMHSLISILASPLELNSLFN